MMESDVQGAIVSDASNDKLNDDLSNWDIPVLGITCKCIAFLCSISIYALVPSLYTKMTSINMSSFLTNTNLGDGKYFTQSVIQKSIEVALRCGDHGNPCSCSSANGVGYPHHFNDYRGFFPHPRGQTFEFPIFSPTPYCKGDPYKYRVIFDTANGAYVGAVYHGANGAFSCCYNNQQAGLACSCFLQGGRCP